MNGLSWALLAAAALAAVWGVTERGKADGLALELARQQSVADSLGDAAAAAREHADSMAESARASVDTARVYVTRWRTLRDTLRLTDTLSVPVLVAAADSLAEWCTYALDG